MYREAISAESATTGMERAHHLTAALYFGIAALEAFLNGEMRESMADEPEDQIIKILRYASIMDKIKKWPEQILSQALVLTPDTISRIDAYNNIRGALTHPKTHGHETYEELDGIDPQQVVLTVAEYIAQYHQAKGDYFEYWLWGWNYLNPAMDSHDIILVNDQQFVISLQAMGVSIPGVRGIDLQAWRNSFMNSFAGYQMVAATLSQITGCEPKSPRFPFQPKLCRLWWTNKHHNTCGNVTPAAIQQAR